VLFLFPYPTKLVLEKTVAVNVIDIPPSPNPVGGVLIFHDIGRDSNVTQIGGFVQSESTALNGVSKRTEVMEEPKRDWQIPYFLIGLFN
jgi:hypothetical protein